MKPQSRFFKIRLGAAIACWLFCGVLSNAACADSRTVESAAVVLDEMMALPVKQIPNALLANAEGVAIIPRVLKVGLVAGVQHGSGVVLLREKDGSWGLPRFITITGGSVGWQIGAQATDFVLVFKTKRSVEGLLEGKFKIGADIAAAAGPVGRRAEASTDSELKAEIYSYSRSRGLFAGVSLDGSVLQLDRDSETAFYGRPEDNPGGMREAPRSAVKLIQVLTQYTAALPAAPVEPQPNIPQNLAGSEAVMDRAESLRRQAAQASLQLSTRLDPAWRTFLALPAGVYEQGAAVDSAALQIAVDRFQTVARDPRYQSLASSREFVALYETLQLYAANISRPTEPKFSLPPPPQADGPQLAPPRR
jgi:lipid-binding SYLF domain-containing protein